MPPKLVPLPVSKDMRLACVKISRVSFATYGSASYPMQAIPEQESVVQQSEHLPVCVGRKLPFFSSAALSTYSFTELALNQMDSLYSSSP